MFNRIKCHDKNQSGQALVVLLFYMVIAVTLVTTAVALTMTGSITTMREEEGNHALEFAENGMENALLKLLRDASYTGETFSMNNGTVVTTVSGTQSKTILSVATKGNYKKTLEVIATITNGKLTVSSWKEL